MTHAPASTHATYRLKMWALLWDRLLSDDGEDRPTEVDPRDQIDGASMARSIPVSEGQQA